MENTKDLNEWRMEAAEKSGGTSPQTVKDFVIRLIEPHRRVRSILDYGAGKGELLHQLSDKWPEIAYTGADILPRPLGLKPEIAWHCQDLNYTWKPEQPFDLVICSEVIEHLENPRQLMRDLEALLAPGGVLVVTTPNQESYRSLLALFFSGNHVHFLGKSYPAHITALVAQDLERMASEVKLVDGSVHYSGFGLVPKLTRFSWQGLSFGLLRGKRFSDCVGLVARKP